MPPRLESLTPMLRHYLEVKAQVPDAILFYRMGDFYELFFEDAQRAAPLLEVTLTARQKGTDSEAPMCGVPHHALDGYVGKLLRAGIKVAICDQVEDPKEAKGLVRRELTRVMTPGTVSEPALLDGREENLLASVAWDGDGGAGAFLDVSTGSFFVRRWPAVEAAREDLEVLRPREVLAAQGELPPALVDWMARREVCRSELAPEDAPTDEAAAEILRRQLAAGSLKGYGLEAGEPAIRAAAAAVAYARETQRNDLSHVRTLAVRAAGDVLVLDPTTLANLEVLRNLREGGRKGTLLAVLDRTASAPGGRRLKEVLQRPLRDRAAIEARHDAVEELVLHPDRRRGLRDELAGIGDPERLAGRSVLGTLGPREAATLRESLARLPAILARVEGSGAARLRELALVDPLADLAADLETTLLAEPSTSVADGGVIAEGVDPDLDRARSLARDSKRHILALEAAERQATGISSLKIRFNKVFGYYIEVTKSNQHLVPEHYIRKQTLANAERYVTPQVKELEEQILAAEERQLALEAEHFRALVRRIAARAAGLQAIGAALAELDVLAAFAEVAAARGYVRPRMREEGAPLVVREGRHPVVEALSREPFVPNDTELDGEHARVVVLTGPNMGGKSTYLRQVALVALMAQAGSFVPAESAELGIVDRIFTRVGASDDLARGESTFMVEMIETARILNQATERSLVILDEVGRGTATFDGLSIAWAIVEHIHDRVGAKTLFATHYHELTELATLLPAVVNRTLAVREWEDRIVFLRRVVAGSADKSYGIQVGRLAGLPGEVIDRAGEILANLEAQEYDVKGRPRLARSARRPESERAAQLELFRPADSLVVDLLRGAELDRMTPLQALNFLHELREKLS